MKVLFIILSLIIFSSLVFGEIKINEIELNPQSSDTDKEWIELYNQIGSDVNISGWKIIDSQQNEEVLDGIISTNGFFIVFPDFTLNNNNENITLKNQFNITIDVSRTISDNDNDNKTWQRKEDGFDTNSDDDWVFKERTFNISNTADFIDPVILDQTRNLDPVFEDDDLILGCLIDEENLEEALIQGTWENGWENFTLLILNESAGMRQLNYTVDENFLESDEFVEWFCIGIDKSGNEGFGRILNFNVVKTTEVETVPSTPDGLNDWFITVPLINLISDARADSIYFRFNVAPFMMFAGAFLFDWNITFGGIERLDFFSSFTERNETIQSEIFKVDITPPQIVDEVPENGSLVESNNIIIGATLDDIYQGNSGVDEDSISLEVDDFRVFDIETIGGPLQKRVLYDTILIDGNHKVKLSVSDIAGNEMTEKIWFFTVNTTPEIVDMQVFSPLPSNLSERKVFFNISLGDKVDRLQYIDFADRAMKRRLCSRCDSYSRFRSFRDGQYNLLIQALKDDNVVASANVDFFIDTKEPRIRRISPEDGDIISGSVFSIEYDEDFLERIELYFDDDIVSRNNCPSGMRQSCAFNLNLEDFGGKEIEFFFILYDRVNNATSRIRRVFVDASEPLIKLNSPFDTEFSKSVLFDIELSEEVRKLGYMDLSSSKQIFKRLCSRCHEFNRTKTFEDGNHSLIFMATDFAGNIGMANISFKVE